MSKKISQLVEITAPSGEETLLLAVNGDSYKFKLRNLSKLVSPATAESVGLGLANNTPDAEKPVSNPTLLVLNQKAPSVHRHNASEIDGLELVGATTVVFVEETW